VKANWEHDWYALGQPYYRIYPSITRLFLGINLAVPCDLIHPPLHSLAIQLPDGKVRGDDWVVNNLLVHVTPDTSEMAIVAYGQCRGMNLTEMLAFPMTHRTVEEQVLGACSKPSLFGSVPGMSLMTPSLTFQCLRIIATLCLIADNPEFVRAEVLAADEDKYEQTRDEKYVEKAKRRGKFGWTIGKHVEVSPHFRNGCLALYWTGRGRGIPTIRWRKESIVHREIVQSVPQGCMALALETDSLVSHVKGSSDTSGND
jgi:hypothetical protein